MSNEVLIPNGDADTAVLLLAAAEKKGMEPGVVRVSTAPSGFLAPEEVAKEAGVDYSSDDEDAEPEESSAPKAAKKTAKKSATKNKES